MKFRIERAKNYIERRQARFVVVQIELEKIKSEDVIIIETSGINTELVEETEHMMQNDEQENEDSELAAFLAAVMSEGNEELANMARSIQTRIKQEPLEAFDDDLANIDEYHEQPCIEDSYGASLGAEPV